MKLTAHMGKFIMVDQATGKRDRLQYARVLVEVKVNHEFPEQLIFINEKGIKTVYELHYEWKPTICSPCKALGHSGDDCRKEVKKNASGKA